MIIFTKLQKSSLKLLCFFVCLAWSFTSLGQAPTTPPSNFQVPSWGVDGNQMYLQWTNGNGARRIVVAREGSAVNASPIDGVDYNASSFGTGDQIGVGNFVVYKGTANGFYLGGLQPSTTYHFAVFELNGTGGSTMYLLTAATGNGTTLSAPTTQPTNLNFNNVAGSTAQLQVTAGNGNGRIFIMRQGAAVNVTPIDLTSYTASSSFGNALTQIGATGNYVVAIGNVLTVSLTNLTPGETYHVAVFEYNGSNGRVFYTNSPLVGQFTTPLSPTIQATNITLPSWGIDGNQLYAQWTNGNGTRRILVAKEGSAVVGIPANGIDYNHNSTFGLGDQLNAGEYIVFDGTSSGSYISGLSPSTTYHFVVFEYNGTGLNTYYLTTNPPFASQATLTAPTLQPSNLVFNNVTGTTTQLQVTAGNGNGRIFIMRAGSAVNVTPVDLANYSASTSFGTAFTQIGATGNHVVSNSSASTVNLTNLVAGETYHVAVFEYNGSSGRVYNTLNPLIGSFTTAVTPTVQAINLNIPSWSFDGNQLYAQWTNGNGARRILVAREASAVTGTPTNGVDYVHNTTFGLGDQLNPGEYVVYDGTGNGSYITGLSPATTYHFTVFEYNNTGVNTNYLIASPPVANASTVSAPSLQPTNLVFANITGTSAQIQLTAGNGNGRFVIMRQGSAVNVTPTDLTNYVTSTFFGQGFAQIGVGNYGVMISNGTSVTVSNLIAGETYHIAVFEYNGSSGRVFNSLNPLVGDFSTVLTPTVASSNLTAPAFGLEGNSLYLQWTSGNGARRIVVARSGSAVSGLPSNSVQYTANANFGSGDQLNVGEYVVYNGTGNGFYMNNLTLETTYHLAIFEFNGTGAQTNYLTTPLIGNFSTAIRPITNSSNLQFNNVTGNSMTLSFTSGSGLSRIIIARAGSAVNVSPVDYAYYGSFNSNFNSAPNFINADHKIVYRGNATSINLTNLTPGETYHFSVFEYNGINAPVYANTALIGSQATLGAPATPASNIAFSQIEGNSMHLSWTNGTGTYRLVIARANNAVTSQPVNGIDYVANANMGLGDELNSGDFVVYSGTGSNLTLNNLAISTTYHFVIYEFNGIGAATQYLFVNPPIASQGTASAPNSSANNITFNSVAQTSMQVGWTNGNGSRRILIAKAGSAVDAMPVDLIAYSNNANFATATDLGNGNKVVYSGTGSNVTVNNLNANTTYHFAVIEMNGQFAPVYQVVAPLIGNETTLSNNTLTIGSLPSSDYCINSPFNVNYFASGTFNPGNIFTIELVDGGGGVTPIGSISSTISGSISCNIPLGTPIGNSYRMQVSASNPVATSANNGYNLTVNNALTVAVTPINFTGCTGDSVTLTSDAVLGNQWYRNGSIIAGANANTLTVFQSGNYTSIVNQASCTATSNVAAVTINSRPPVPTISASGSTSFCAGDSVVLSTQVGFNYDWLLNGVSIGLTTRQITVSSPGNYSVVISNGNCTNTSLATTISNTALPQQALIQAIGNTTVCAGASVTISSDFANANTQWYRDSSPIPSTSNMATYITGTAGTYTLVYTVNGCASVSNIVTIQVIGGQTITLSSLGGNNFCTGNNLDLQSSEANGNIWQLNGMNQAVLTGQTVTISTGGIYQVLIDAGSGCFFSSNTLQINQYDQPSDVAITSNGTVSCPGDPILLEAYSTISGPVVTPLPGYLTYQWYRDNVLIPGANSYIYVASQTGDYVVEIGTPAGCEIFSNNILLNFNNTAPITSFVGSGNYQNHWVFPLVGGLNSQFRFEAIYSDADGDMPLGGFPRVEIDVNGNGRFDDLVDIILPMVETDPTDLNTVDGKNYIVYANNLPISNTMVTRVVSRDANNCAHLGQGVNGPTINLQLGNLYIFANDITFSNPNPAVGDTITVSARVHNNGTSAVQNVLVALYQGDTLIYTTNVPSISGNSSVLLNWNHAFSYDGFFPMKVVVDTPNAIIETNEFDNFASRPVIAGNYQLASGISTTRNFSPGNNFVAGYPLVISGNAYYDGFDRPVSGATVTMRLNGSFLRSTYTNALGDFSAQWPQLSPGTYFLTGEVTDFTVTGYFADTIVISAPPIIPLPDLVTWTTTNNISPLEGQSVNGFLYVRNIGQAVSGGFTTTLTTCYGLNLAWPHSGLNIGETDSISYSQLFDYGGYCDFNGFNNFCNFIANIDVLNEVQEFFEFNNNHLLRIEPRKNQPDLRILPVLMSAQNFVNPFNFTYSIINRGGVPSGAFRVTITDRYGVNEVQLDQFVHNNLAPCAFLNRGLQIVFPTNELHEIIVRVDDLNQVAEWDETNNIGISTNVPGLVDLSVQKCYSVNDVRNMRNHPTDPRNIVLPDSTHLIFTIRNSGSAQVLPGTPIKTRFVINQNYTFFHEYTGGVGLNSSFTDTVKYAMPAIGQNQIQIFTNYDSSIAEAVMGNNSQTECLGYNFDTRYTGWNLTYYLNSNVALPAPIANFGLYQGDSITIRWTIDGVLHETQRVAYNSHSCNGHSSFLSNKIFNQTGQYRVLVEIDYDSIYAECDENNNQFEVTYNIINPVDFRVLSQFINPSKLNPQPNEPIDIFLTYENIGTAWPQDSVWLVCTVDDVQIGDSILVPPVGPGQFNTVQVGGQYASNMVGLKTIRSYIDAANDVIEGNELNNEASRLIIVGDASNLFVNEISFSDSLPNLGDPMVITALIGNSGFLDNEAQIQFYYVNDNLDTILIGTSQVIDFLQHDTVPVSTNWVCADPITYIIVRIVNVRDPEFNDLDNEKGKALGALTTVSISGTIVDSVACNGFSNGIGSVSAAGGIPPYQFNWSNGAIGTNVSNLAAGSGFVRVTDAIGQRDTLYFTILQPDVISVNMQTFGNACVVDSVVAAANGGTAPYSYTWTYDGGGGQTALILTASNTATLSLPTSGVIYTLTVSDAKGCNISRVYSYIADCDTQPGPSLNLCGRTDLVIGGTPGANNQIRIPPSSPTNSFNRVYYQIKDAADAVELGVIVRNGINTRVRFEDFPAIFQWNTNYTVRFVTATGVIVPDFANAAPCIIGFGPEPINNNLPLTSIFENNCGLKTFVIDLNAISNSTGVNGINHINCTRVPNATGYDFEIRDSITNNIVGILNTNWLGRIFTGNYPAIFNWNTTYLVRVRVLVGNITGAWGPSCSIGFIENPSVITPQSTALQICNLSDVEVTTRILPRPVIGASSFTFNFFSDAACTQLYASSTILSSKKLFVGDISPGLLPNTTYYVTVTGYVAGLPTPTGDTCTIIMGLPMVKSSSNMGLFELVGYPNPFSDQAQFIVKTSNSNQLISIRLYDVMGRTIVSKAVTANESHAFGNELANGTYLLEATDNYGNRSTFRFVKVK